MSVANTSNQPHDARIVGKIIYIVAGGDVYAPLRMFPLLYPDPYESFHLERRDLARNSALLHGPREEVEFPLTIFFL